MMSSQIFARSWIQILRTMMSHRDGLYLKANARRNTEALELRTASAMATTHPRNRTRYNFTREALAAQFEVGGWGFQDERWSEVGGTAFERGATPSSRREQFEETNVFSATLLDSSESLAKITICPVVVAWSYQ